MEFELGFRFRPSDSERLAFLLRFIGKHDLQDGGFISTNVDVYGKEEPWEIYHRGVPCGRGDGEAQDCSSYRFFITKLKMKDSGKRFKREVGKGTWKQDNGKPVRNEKSVVIGLKKSMSYVNKKLDSEALGGKWLMKEYEFSKLILHQFPQDCRNYVLCAIRKKPNTSSSTTTSLKLNSSLRHQETSTTSVDNSWAMVSLNSSASSVRDQEPVESESIFHNDFTTSVDNSWAMVSLNSSAASVRDQEPVESETIFHNDFTTFDYNWDKRELDDLDIREFLNGI